MVISTPLKNMKVSWDDYSQYMEKKKNVPNHQPDYLFINIYHIYIYKYIMMKIPTKPMMEALQQS